METVIEIYNVIPSDSLITIGEKLGMTEDEVREFHNKNCEKHGLMWFNSFIGVEKLVLPKNFKSEAQIKKENFVALPSKNILPGFYAENYKVSESFESDIENTIDISYTVNIKLEKIKNVRTKILVASVSSSDFLTEGEKPDDKISELSIVCAESIEPLQFQVLPEGTIVKVHHFEKLQKKFEEKRKEIEDFFIGEVSAKYLDQFAKNIGDHEYVDKQIDSTFLYQILFPNMNWFHKLNNWKETFYLIKNSFPLSCNFNVEFHHLNDKEIQTVIKAEVVENVSLQQLLRGKKLDVEDEERMTGLVELKYTTHKIIKQLLKVEAGIALIHETEIYRKHKITVSKI